MSAAGGGLVLLAGYLLAEESQAKVTEFLYPTVG